jgi:hypothetical protein
MSASCHPALHFLISSCKPLPAVLLLPHNPCSVQQGYKMLTGDSLRWWASLPCSPRSLQLQIWLQHETSNHLGGKCINYSCTSSEHHITHKSSLFQEHSGPCLINGILNYLMWHQISLPFDFGQSSILHQTQPPAPKPWQLAKVFPHSQYSKKVKISSKSYSKYPHKKRGKILFQIEFAVHLSLICGRANGWTKPCLMFGLKIEKCV